MRLRITWYAPEINKKLNNHIDKSLRNACIGYIQLIRSLFNSPGFPKVVTGNLSRSFIYNKIGKGIYEVGTNVSYAPYLEFGTIKMGPKPFMRPSLNLFKHKILEYFK